MKGENWIFKSGVWGIFDHVSETETAKLTLRVGQIDEDSKVEHIEIIIYDGTKLIHKLNYSKTTGILSVG